MLSFFKAVARPLPALASIATVAGLYIGWSQVHEAELSRTAQQAQFLAEKAPRLVPTRVYASDTHVLIELRNEGESKALHVGIDKGFIRSDGSSISGWEFTSADKTLEKGESARLYVTDLNTAQGILGYHPKTFEEKRFARPQPNAGVLQVAVNYQDAFGNQKHLETDFVARP